LDHGAQLLWFGDPSPPEDRLRQFLVQNGYQVMAVASPAEACRSLESGPPDLLLLHLRPPEQEGLEVCRFLRGLPNGEDVPVLAILEPGAPGGPSAAMRAGADDFLIRPLPPAELQSRVRILMRMRMMRLELRRDMEAILGLMAQKEGLVRFVAHDLKNLLGTLLTNLELLEGHPDRVSRYRGRIEASTRTMLGMVQNMLDLSVQEEGALTLRPSRFQVGTWLDWIRPELEAPTARRGQRLVLGADPELEVEADPQLLQRALVNLLDNACKYGPEDSEVRLSVHGLGEAVRFQVADLGPGIPEDLKRRVFDRFARLDPEGAPYVGHGLGLAFCQLVATLHGGSIWVEDNEPRGSRFVLELPA
jgi:signal transduction histidine kinase